jgi:hypothetical protein
MFKCLALILAVLIVCECRSVARHHSRSGGQLGLMRALRQDHYGCDLPDIVNFQCTWMGGCCDQHDACIAKYDCGGFNEGEFPIAHRDERRTVGDCQLCRPCIMVLY